MSEQTDALLQIPSSYNFTRDRVKNYRDNHINSNNFFDWTRNNMYRSSYAHHHSPVHIQPPRIQQNHEPIISQATKASSPKIEPKVFMLRHSQIKQKKSSTVAILTSTDQVWQRPDSISQKILLLINLKMLPVINMENPNFKDLTLPGSYNCFYSAWRMEKYN